MKFSKRFLAQISLQVFFSLRIWPPSSRGHPLCLPRLLQVPVEIHDAWKKGGESRASLAKMLAEANWNKEIYGWSSFWMQPTSQIVENSMGVRGHPSKAVEWYIAQKFRNYDSCTIKLQTFVPKQKDNRKYPQKACSLLWVGRVHQACRVEGGEKRTSPNEMLGWLGQRRQNAWPIETRRVCSLHHLSNNNYSTALILRCWKI